MQTLSLSTLLHPCDLPDLCGRVLPQPGCLHRRCKGEYTVSLSSKDSEYAAPFPLKDGGLVRTGGENIWGTIYSRQRQTWLAAFVRVWRVCVQRQWRNTTRLWCVEKQLAAASRGVDRRAISKTKSLGTHPWCSKTNKWPCVTRPREELLHVSRPAPSGPFFSKTSSNSLIFFQGLWHRCPATLKPVLAAEVLREEPSDVGPIWFFSSFVTYNPWEVEREKAFG